jgi:hypothetical protein
MPSHDVIVLEQVPYKDNFYGNRHGRGQNLTLDEFYSKHGSSIDSAAPVTFCCSTVTLLCRCRLSSSCLFPVLFLGLEPGPITTRHSCS